MTSGDQLTEKETWEGRRGMTLPSHRQQKLEPSTEENRKTVTGTGPRSVSILAKIFLVPEKVWLSK